MARKLILYGLMVIFFTLLAWTWMVRDSLCELPVKQGNTEIAAVLSDEING
ncbi:Hok/Gef family protein [Rahnella sp. Lac-M11]|jgi:protein HokA|uniref:Hok/Gef family protein n=1 Tax=Rahnella contaminans TaxID=2703882 RepID=A0A6M2AXE8_9GAMM|nr:MULTISPECIES: Hok/Gef family protein [Rahnella]MDF1893619.1 Hok/Gef family protein [Rahnella contaminans]NGX85606.1 Hok/Gef family protein [Rahnella contaminans]